jgi:hypothetical protein
MSAWIKIFVSISWIFISASVFAQIEEQQVLDCESVFAESGFCPENLCNKEIKCSTESEQMMCAMACHPKECVTIKAKDCPLGRCVVLTGCSAEKVCYPPMQDNNLGCGDLAYIGEKECCESLVKRCGVEFLDDSCDMLGENSIDSVPVCIPCGNGVCNQFENLCNCPEDCG